MKHVVAILVAALAAIFVLHATNRRESFSFPDNNRDAVRIDGSIPNRQLTPEQRESDSNPVVAELAAPEDVGQRRQIAGIMKEVIAENNPAWARSFSFTERSGEKVTSESLKGEPYIANFFFTLCPASCKMQTEQMGLLQKRYKDLPVRLVSISVDPAVDTPEVLTQYADAAGALPDKWLFVTGDMKQISKIGNEVFLLGSIQERGHPDRFCLVDENGVLVGKYNWHDPHELAAMDEHLRELIAAMPE